MHFNGREAVQVARQRHRPARAADRFGADPLRLYLVREIPFGGDGDFSWERFEERYNADLANDLGQPGQPGHGHGREVPRPVAAGGPARARSAARSGRAGGRDVSRCDGRFAVHEAAFAAFSIVDATNAFIAASEPWALAKDPARAETLTQVLCDAAEALRIAAVLLLPVMPTTAGEILRRAGEPAAADAITFDRDTAWKASLARTLVKGPAIWPRLDGSTAAAPAAGVVTVTDPTAQPATQPANTSEAVAPPAPSAQADGAPTAAPADSRVGIDQFMSVELRVARVSPRSASRSRRSWSSCTSTWAPRSAPSWRGSPRPTSPTRWLGD